MVIPAPRRKQVTAEPAATIVALGAQPATSIFVVIHALMVRRLRVYYGTAINRIKVVATAIWWTIGVANNARILVRIASKVFAGLLEIRIVWAISSTISRHFSSFLLCLH